MKENASTKMQLKVPTVEPEFYRLPEVLAFTGFKSRSHLYVLAKAGKFPKPVVIGPNSIAWRRRELQAWADNLPTVEPGRDKRSANTPPKRSRKRKAADAPTEAVVAA